MPETLLEDLKGQITQRQAVVLVGAGVSIGATNRRPCASWTGLLHHGVDRCVQVAPSLPAGWAERVRAEIDSGDMDDLLHMLALLPNGLALGDLAAVTPGQGDAAAAVLRKAGLAFDEAGRLRLLAPLREYVRRKYPPEPKDLERLVAHFVKLAAEQGDKVGAKGGAEAVRRLVPEAANVEAMILLGLEGGQPTTTIRAAIAWSEFILFTGVGTEHPIAQATAVAQKNGDWQNSAICIQRLGNIVLARSDHAAAQARYEEALLLYRQVGSVLGEANCIQSLGDIALARSDHTTAREKFEAALALYEQIQEPYSIGMTHWRLARMASEGVDRSRHVQAARAACERIDRLDLVRDLEKEFGAVS